MNNISDLVPLIIIVGSIIYSIVKSTGKAKQEETAKTTLPGKKEIPFPDNTFEFPEIIEQPVYEEEKKKGKAKKQEKTMAYPAQISHTPHKPIVNSPAFSLGSSFLEEEEETGIPMVNLNDADELKKAFIYTEILKRKEY